RNQHPEQTCTRGLRGINACGDGCMSNRNEAGSPVTCSGEEVTFLFIDREEGLEFLQERWSARFL
ncbi:MAG: hypothetical protein U9N12_08755, partial [Euryarchaeota archaeon]|nr:hypothetical protein [Euryarchaeota archaeon]